MRTIRERVELNMKAYHLVKIRGVEYASSKLGLNIEHIMYLVRQAEYYQGASMNFFIK